MVAICRGICRWDEGRRIVIHGNRESIMEGERGGWYVRKGYIDSYIYRDTHSLIDKNNIYD